MTENLSPRVLHDRATRGIVLSAKENVILEAWYAQQDAEEDTMLTANAPLSSSIMEEKIDMALVQIQTVTQQIQTLTIENTKLKREVALLSRRLEQTKTAQLV